MKLQGKNAIITGAGRGIGAAIAELFAAQGANVACVSRTQANSDRTAEVVRAAGRRALALAVDVGDCAASEKAFDQVVAEFGTVDILVNNAGVTKDTLLMRMSEADWDEVLRVNLKGAFNWTKPAVKHMVKQRSGRIINISSVIGLIGNAGQCNYAASKAGLIGFTKSVARETATRGITCNAIAPGFIVSDMTSELPQAVKDKVLAGIPSGRFGEPADIAETSLFLASTASSYITGQVLAVDGGMVM